MQNSLAPSKAAKPIVLWFRRDLRIRDNQALDRAFLEASKTGASVVALFVLDPRLVASSGPNRLAFLIAALQSLRDSGVPLVVRIGDPAEIVSKVAKEVAAETVVFASDYSPYGATRDRAVNLRLKSQGVQIIEAGSPYVVTPGTTRKIDGTAFKVFTPFRRVWEQHADAALASRHNVPINAPSRQWRADLLSDPLPEVPEDISPRLSLATEEAATDRLEYFCEHHLHAYDVNRNIPAADATSRISADLKFGLLHPLQILPRLGVGGSGADIFRSELCWREFYADVLWHRPETTKRAFNPMMEMIEVDGGPQADERFNAWCAGQTGFPFIDAGMRQLLEEGWMHNRVRMAAASFLVKDLHIDWRRGATWFMQLLVDGDIASNQHGWQWTAGTGTDAAPYFRVFNPTSQGKKFDPEGAYIRRYVPELRNVPVEQIHDPIASGIVDLFRTNPTYPSPIVDHATERSETLARYAAIRSMNPR